MGKIEELSEEQVKKMEELSIEEKRAKELEEFDRMLATNPLFMKPEDMPKKVEENPTLQAIQSLLYDGTPDEIAKNFKNRGNEAFDKGKSGYKDALTYYDKALECKITDMKLKSIILCNRAAVDIELQNYRQAIVDGKESLKCNPQNVKSFYRIARAARMIQKFDEALEYCNDGLKLDNKNMALLAEKEKIEKEKEDFKKKEEEKLKEKEAERKEKEKLNKAIKERGIKVEESNLTEDISFAKEYRVYLDTDNKLHWPVMFLYPEYQQTDFIGDFHEDDRFIDQLEAVFEEKPTWDAESKYKAKNIVLYFETFLKNGKSSVVKVGTSVALKKVLSHPNYIVRDYIPSFIAVVKDSKFEQSFLASFKS